MKVNVENLVKLASENDWSIPTLAENLGVEYSYLFRILNKEKNGGSKLFSGIYVLCKEKDLNIEDYIFLPSPLSTNNDSGAKKKIKSA